MGNVHMEAAQINYRGGEKKMSVEEALKTTSGEAAAIAQLQSDVADLNTEKANKADIATEFSDLTNYNAGDLVYYEGTLYEFQVDHTAGAWETSEVIQKDLSDIVTTLKSGLTAIDKIAQYPFNATTMTDFNDLMIDKAMTIYQIGTNVNMANKPSSGSFGILVVYRVASYYVQLWLPADGNIMHRVYTNSTWTNWR